MSPTRADHGNRAERFLELSFAIGCAIANSCGRSWCTFDIRQGFPKLHRIKASGDEVPGQEIRKRKGKMIERWKL